MAGGAHRLVASCVVSQPTKFIRMNFDPTSLIAEEGLDASYASIVRNWWLPLAEAIARRRGDERTGRGLVVGINGAQGSGKSTLCRFLQAILHTEFGLSTATLSLDDLYLPLSERNHLGQTIHPLLATRGPPGTHDISLGLVTIEGAVAGRGTLLLPRFDKSRDDRCARSDWEPIDAPVDILLFEGWMVAARPQSCKALIRPVNVLEAEDDVEGVWRRYANISLGTDYPALFGKIDFLVALIAPSFERVREWRLLQEHKLRKRTGGGMSDTEVARFMQFYERLTRQMLTEIPQRANVSVKLDLSHNPVRICLGP